MKKLFEIKYDNNITEIETAFKLFYKKYATRRMIIFTIVYAIVIALGINLIVTNYTAPYGYILTALGLGVLVNTWTKPVSVRKKLVATLSELNEEKYTAVFGEDRIEISTEIIESSEETETVAITTKGIITVEENSEAAKELAEQEPPKPEIQKSVYKLAETELFSMETGDCFLLFVNRSLIHVFPKRCLSDEESRLLSEYFDDKAI